MKPEVAEQVQKAIDKAVHDLGNELSPLAINERLDVHITVRKDEGDGTKWRGMIVIKIQDE